MLYDNVKSQQSRQTKTAIVVLDDIINEVDDECLKEELRSINTSWSILNLKKARHKVFKYAIDNFDAKIVDEELDHFFSNLKWTAKVYLAFGFILKKQ